MDDDGIAQLLNATTQGVFQTAEGFEEDLQALRESEEGCPVHIIHVDRGKL
jgi:ferredoxin